MIKQKNESVFLGWWSWNILLYELDVGGIDNGCTGIHFTVFKVESCYLKDIFSKPLNIRSKYCLVTLYIQKNIVHTSRFLLVFD